MLLQCILLLLLLLLLLPCVGMDRAHATAPSCWRRRCISCTDASTILRCCIGGHADIEAQIRTARMRGNYVALCSSMWLTRRCACKVKQQNWQQQQQGQWAQTGLDAGSSGLYADRIEATAISKMIKAIPRTKSPSTRSHAAPWGAP